MSDKPLPDGKLDAGLLEELLGDMPQDDSVRVPPGIGLDAAGLRVDSRHVAVAVDPITFATERPGTYSLAVNINDVVCQGCEPRWFTVSLLMPSGSTETDLRAVWEDLENALSEQAVTPVSGHTEVTDAVNRPLVAGQIIGTPVEEGFLDPRRAQPGDTVYLWRTAALEGAALIAREFPDRVKHHVGEEVRKVWERLLDDPGICVWPEARSFVTDPSVVALHDPTEGGVITALHELADAANAGVDVTGDSISFPEGFQEFCESLNVDAMGVLSSGCLLVVVERNSLEAFRSRQGDKVRSVGTLRDDDNRFLRTGESSGPLNRYNQDQIIPLMDSLTIS